MTKNNLVLLLKYMSHLDYPILTPFISLISLCAFIEVGLIHSLGTLTLKDIDHMSIMKSTVYFPLEKKVESLAKMNKNMLVYIGNLKLLDSYIGRIG